MSVSKNGTGAADFLHELHKLLLAVVVQVCSCVIETEVCVHSEFFSTLYSHFVALLSYATFQK